MSSGINVYAVPTARLNEVIGSGDQAVIDAIVAGQESFLSGIDDIDDEAEMSCADAVADLVNGERASDGPGYLYGYALEAICAHIGDELPNICPIAGTSEWIEAVDVFLESKKVPLRLNDLVNGRSPVPIPEPDDYPFIGQWPATDITAALSVFRSLNLTGIAEEMIETLSLILTWLEAAAKTPGAAVVGFLS